jgi:hypothetical protein
MMNNNVAGGWTGIEIMWGFPWASAVIGGRRFKG